MGRFCSHQHHINMKSFYLKHLAAALTSACLVTTLTHANPPPVTVAQPVQVKVVDPVTVTGKVDVGNKVEISGRVETINDALKIPFHLTVAKITDGEKIDDVFYTVPPGMRLTIESVSARVEIPTGQKVYAILGIFSEDGSSSANYLPFQLQGSFGDDVFVSSQNLKIIVDPSSSKIVYKIIRNSIVGGIIFGLTVNGYLEALP